MPRARRSRPDDAPAPLEEYRAKRDFEATPEPTGAAEPPGTAPKRARFVVQEHHARALHWDLRLEHDGVLLSWAVPKGIPSTPQRNHLAVHTEDHPLEYLDFEGEIPDGNYGAGTMRVWDRGEYELHELRDDKVVATFHGERVRGRYALFQTHDRNWMIHRMDPPSDPGRAPVPSEVRPMLATPTPNPPTGPGWAWEMKWDGIRALTTIDGGRVRIANRGGRDITHRYPELRALGEALGSIEAVLDGELVIFDGARPDFQLIQRRMHVDADREIRRLATELPAVFVIFDLLWLDGHSTMPLPYAERRRILLDLGLSGAAWQTPPHEVGDGAATMEVTERFGLEGVVAKRLDSPYEPGRRSRAWMKWKRLLRQEFVVGGWMPGTAGRTGQVGSLLVGYYDEAGEPGGATLNYAGRVGTGFTQAELARLESELAPLRRDSSPFASHPGGRGNVPKAAVFVEPRLVVEVRFTEWTSGGSIRQPAYMGERDDKPPTEVVRELRP
jgi:bifunctional non-homologous end joining protein LigD